MSRELIDLPGIYRASLEMAYDSGGINRDRTEEVQRGQLHEFLVSYDADDADLRSISDWLNALSQDDIEKLTAGDDEQIYSVLADAPNHLQQMIDGLLTDIFQEVC